MAMRPRSTAHATLVVLTTLAALAAVACTPAPPPEPLDFVASAETSETTTQNADRGPVVIGDQQLDPLHDELVEPSDAERSDDVGAEAEAEAEAEKPERDDHLPGADEQPSAAAPDVTATLPATAEDTLPGAEDRTTATSEPELRDTEVGDTEVGDAGTNPSPEPPEADDEARSAARSIVPVPRSPAPVDSTPPPASGSTVAAQAEPGERVVLDVGHVDLVEVTRSGERLVISVKDDTDASGVVFRRPSDVQSRVRDGARTQVPPGPAFDFLGAVGSDVWLLPQVQDPQLLWPGWSTERLGAGQVEGNAVTLRLRSVDGPGRVDLFTTDQFGAPNRIFGPGTSDELTVPINTHTHANWAFSAPGQYRVTFEVSATIAGGGATTSAAEYVFLVGDDTPLVPWESIADPGPGGGGPDGGPGGGGPGDAPGGAGSPTVPGEVSPGGAAAGVGNGPRSVGGGGAGNGGAGSAGSGGAGALARTGGDAGGVLVVGLGLVTFGLVSVGVGRRRRNRAALLGRA